MAKEKVASIQIDGADTFIGNVERARPNMPASQHDNNDSWTRIYDAAKHDVELRRYELADKRIQAVLKQCKQGSANEKGVALCRLLMAKIALAHDQYAAAEKLLSLSLPDAKKYCGETSLMVADCKYCLAQALFMKGKTAAAENLCRDAMKIREQELGAGHDLGQCLVLSALILNKNGWLEQAQETMNKGIQMLIAHSQENSLDLADALRSAALVFHSQGEEQEAHNLFVRSYEIMDKAAKLNLPPLLAAEIRYRWEEGSPRSLEIPDAEFPLKYVTINNMRVAATVIDLWELFGVLISITNVGDYRMHVGLGKPVLTEATNDLPPKYENLEFIDANNIDRIRRERTMWDLTQNRPWLANIQKTRNQRGFVPAHGHDLFRGPNIFGIYGHWGALPRELPDKFMLEPSPERVQYQAEVQIDPGLVQSSAINVKGLTPVDLEPFESRTGELFFMNPRCERLLLKIPIGNVVVEIPFSAQRRRIK